MKTKMNPNQARVELYDLWQKCRLPEDFTNEHANYEDALNLLLQKGNAAIPEILALYNSKADSQP